MKELENEGNKLLIDLRMALLDPTDIKGYPYRDEVDNKIYVINSSEIEDNFLIDNFITEFNPKI